MTDKSKEIPTYPYGENPARDAEVDWLIAQIDLSGFGPPLSDEERDAHRAELGESLRQLTLASERLLAAGEESMAFADVMRESNKKLGEYRQGLQNKKEALLDPASYGALPDSEREIVDGLVAQIDAALYVAIPTFTIALTQAVADLSGKEAPENSIPRKDRSLADFARSLTGEWQGGNVALSDLQITAIIDGLDAGRQHAEETRRKLSANEALRNARKPG